MTSLKKHSSVILIILFLILHLQACSTTQTGFTSQNQLPQPKNIIYFIGDGMGFNHVTATNYFQYGEDKAQIYQQDDWLQLAQATYSSIMHISNTDTVYSSGYNPKQAAVDFDYPKRDATDSGAAGTALSTGVKTYGGAIGLGPTGDTLIHISQAAKAIGKSTGIVTSVQLSHATPAAFAAHNRHRNNYSEIAKYLLFNTKLDVIMGAGNPDFNNNGQPEQTSPQFVGNREIWEMLKANDSRTVFETTEGVFQVTDTRNDGNPTPWTLVQTREEFQQLASGPTPDRVIGVPMVHTTLQQDRTNRRGRNRPFQIPLNENIPTLAEMTTAAINVLNQNTNGFFVMIEGGAIDWASHGNDTARMIEEMVDFNLAIEAAVQWVETYSSWDETLIIVTSDHECGYLTGPISSVKKINPVANNGKDNIPGVNWNHGNHTNLLVPFYAKGPGTELFKLMADEKDPIYGYFIQNAEIPQSIFLMWGKPEVELHKIQ